MCKIIFQPYSIILDSSLKNGNRFYSRDRHLNPLIKKSVAIDNQSRYFEAFIKCSALLMFHLDFILQLKSRYSSRSQDLKLQIMDSELQKQLFPRKLGDKYEKRYKSL